MMYRIKKLSVIIAAYQEEKNIAETITRVHHAVPDAEILVVDDGSSDSTSAVAKRTAKGLKMKKDRFKLIRYTPNKGKGNAIRVGIDKASGDVQVQVDADSQFPPEQIPLLLKPIQDGIADITFASRYCRNATYEKGSVTRLARLATWVDSFFTSVLAGQRLTDVNAGFKAWKTDVIRDLDIRCRHFGYEPEIAVLAGKKRYRIVEVPIDYKARKQGKSAVSLLRDGFRITWFIIKTKMLR